MLEVESLTKYYDTKEIGPFNLSFGSNSLVAIIGKSGSGKSTLIKMVTNIVQSDKGSVVFNHGPLKKEDYTYISQIGTLFSHLTIKENILLTNKVEDIDILKVMEKLNLSKKYLHKYPFELSGGERQRVSLIRAIISKSKIIILDEALSALDTSSKDDIYEILKDLKKDYNLLIIFITHDIDEALYLGDRIIMLSEGKVVFNNKSNKFLNQENIPILSELINKNRLERLNKVYNNGI